MRQIYRILLAAIFLHLTFITNAQHKEVTFSKGSLKINQRTINIEIAGTPEQMARGLMYRKQLPENAGMLFVYPEEDLRSFWMKNTFIDLSIGFFNSNKELVDVQDMSPVHSEIQINIPSYVSRKPAKYALEVNKGWFKRNNISIGTKFEYSHK